MSTGRANGRPVYRGTLGGMFYKTPGNNHQYLNTDQKAKNVQFMLSSVKKKQEEKYSMENEE